MRKQPLKADYRVFLLQQSHMYQYEDNTKHLKKKAYSPFLEDKYPSKKDNDSSRFFSTIWLTLT